MLLVVTVLAGCVGEKADPQEAKVREFSLPVEIGKVVYMDVADQLRTVGNIRAEQRVVITAEMEGQVVRLPVEEGMRVSAGDLIAQIDPREYQLEVERLRAKFSAVENEFEKARQGLRPEEQERLVARVKADESGLELALKELARTEKLVEERVVSQSVLDQAQDRVRQAEETLRASRAALSAGLKGRDEDIGEKESELEGVRKQLAMAELKLSKGVIRAPFGGVIISKKIEQGAFAKEGVPIVEMIGSSRLKAVIEVPQSYRGKLNRLESIQFEIKQLDLRFQLNKDLGRLVRVIPDADIFSGNIPVQVDLEDPPAELFPGLTLEGVLRFGTRRNVMHVPAVALVITEKGTVVYIVKDGKAHLVPVKAFKEGHDFVEIQDFTHQLGPQVDLILRGSGAVFPGAKVFPTNPEPSPEVPFNAASKNSRQDKKPLKKPKT